MTDRVFPILNECLKNVERFGGSFEDEIVKAYERYESLRATFPEDQLEKLDELLKDLAEYYKYKFGNDIPLR